MNGTVPIEFLPGQIIGKEIVKKTGRFPECSSFKNQDLTSGIPAFTLEDIALNSDYIYLKNPKLRTFFIKRNRRNILRKEKNGKKTR